MPAYHPDTFVPRFTQEQLLQRLAQAGLDKPIPTAEVLRRSASLRDAENLVSRNSGGAVLVTMRGEDLTDWLGTGLDGLEVWSFHLPDSWSGLAGGLAEHAGIAFVNGAISHPWHWHTTVRIVPSSSSGLWDDSPKLVLRHQDCARSFDNACTAGGLVILYTCAGMTYPTVHAVDVGDLCAIQSAAMSSSARVLDAHTLEELQSLTRVWEDGADGRRAGLCPLAVAVHDMADYLATASTLSAGEAVSAHAWVESQTFLQVHYESHGSEDGLGLRAVVGGDDYRAFSTSACEVSVLQRDNCYVLTLRHCADALDIALPIFDLGSIPWFMQWSARGHCTLTLQSLLSGRVTVLTVAWPAGFKGPVVPEFAPPAADEAARADQEYRTLFGNECAI